MQLYLQHLVFVTPLLIPAAIAAIIINNNPEQCSESSHYRQLLPDYLTGWLILNHVLRTQDNACQQHLNTDSNIIRHFKEFPELNHSRRCEDSWQSWRTSQRHISSARGSEGVDLYPTRFTDGTEFWYPLDRRLNILIGCSKTAKILSY
jgi:hypothetical protein